MAGKQGWQRSDGRVSGKRHLEKTRKPAQKVAVLRTLESEITSKKGQPKARGNTDQKTLP